ncbi:thioredoxin family protein [Patescibacteria group bacterium]|nr:thioredoxin family protein [Patescibacteria group bacterium]
MKVIKIGAIWCSGCMIMKPLWEEIEKENPWLETEYYDYDENEEMMKKYEINDRLPVFIFLDKDGNEILRLMGEKSKEEILKTIEENKEK